MIVVWSRCFTTASHQLRIPSFPIELVKTEFDFTVRSVEPGLGR